jgi:polyisoprenoid-binding protein YceI
LRFKGAANIVINLQLIYPNNQEPSMYYTKFIAIAGAALLGLSQIPAPLLAAETYTLDKAHTQIRFAITRGGWTEIAGWFKEFDGTISFDEAEVSNSKISVSIRTGSLDTGWDARDKFLRSPAFFNAKELPEMAFTSTKIEKTGPKTGRMTGNLTLLGKTNPVTLDIKFNRKAAHPRIKKTFVGFTAIGILKRSDYGMRFLLPAIGDEVRIRIEALAVRK